MPEEEEEESNIQKAKPKRGLQTGGTQSAGGLHPPPSAADQIALRYDQDLSGRNGPKARFDAIRELAVNEIDQREIESTTTSGDGSSLTGFGRHKILQSEQPVTRGGGGPVEVEEGTSEKKFWDLLIITEGEQPPVFVLEPNGGAIMPQGSVKLDDGYTIEDVTAEHAPQADKTLYLRAVKDEMGELEMFLVYDSGWEGQPYVYEIEEYEHPAESMVAYNYPLYHTYAEHPGGIVIPVGEFFLRRLAPNASFAIEPYLFKDEDEDRVVATIVFVDAPAPFIP